MEDRLSTLLFSLNRFDKIGLSRWDHSSLSWKERRWLEGEENVIVVDESKDPNSRRLVKVDSKISSQFLLQSSFISLSATQNSSKVKLTVAFQRVVENI